jgi:hypothetical protein
MSSDRVLGLFRATVANNADPLSQTRVTLFIPQVLGSAESAWATPSSPTNRVPDIGQVLWVQFSGGDITKPVYEPLGLLEITASQMKAGTITAESGVIGSLDVDLLTGETITGATVQTDTSGRRISLDPDGNLRLYTGSPAEAEPARITTDTDTMSAQFIGPQVDGGVEYGITMQDSFGVQGISISADQTSIFGLFDTECIRTGTVSITPSAANTPTAVTVTGLGPLPGSVHRAFVTANSQVPGTVKEVTATNVTNDGLTVWVSREDTVTTNVWYVIFSS